MPNVMPMIWNIKCRKTRRLLALWAGSDLEQRECQVVERHLAVCPGCRQVWDDLQRSQQVLEKARPLLLDAQERPLAAWPVDAFAAASLWPAVERHIRLIDATTNASVNISNRVALANWRDWLPAGAVVAACLGIIVLNLPQVPPMGDTASPAVIESSPAAFASNPQFRNVRLTPPDDVDDPPRF